MLRVVVAYLRLSFGVLEDCHGVGVGDSMTHDGRTENSGQVTDVHLRVQTVSNSVGIYQIQLHQ